MSDSTIIDNNTNIASRLDKEMDIEVQKKTENTKLILQFFVTFVIGGLIIAGIPILMKKADSTIAAIVYGLPFSFLPIICIIYFFEGKQVDVIRDFSVQSTLSLLLLLLFQAIFAILIGIRSSNVVDGRKPYKFTLWSTLGICFGAWVVAAFFLFVWIRYKQTGVSFNFIFTPKHTPLT